MLNKVFIIGNLTRDPDYRRLNSGAPVCNIGLAMNRKWKDNAGNPQEKVTFVDVTIFGAQADFAGQYLKKGNRVFVEARLKLDQWVDNASGQNRSKLGLVANSIQNLSPRADSSDGYAQGAPPPSQQQQRAQPPRQDYNQSQQRQAPPPPPFPSRGQDTDQGNYPDPDNGCFDVSDEGIDDIPF